ncbi:MAG: DUF3658 domain-containing protein [Pseudomonadota bacterium]
MTAEHEQMIRSAILSKANNRLQKVARVVAQVMLEKDLEYADSDIAGVAAKMVDEGLLVAAGSVRDMRFAEIKLA